MPAKKARRKRARKAHSSREYEYQDATKPFTLHVTADDIKGARPGDSRNCVLSRAGRREHNCFDITVFRNVAYVRRSERAVPTRYQVTQSAHDLLVSFDASGRSHPITITFVPPRGALSKKQLRSAEQRARRKASRERCKLRAEQHVQAVAEGRGRRKTYTKPDPLTLFGVRNGAGVRPFARVRS